MCCVCSREAYVASEHFLRCAPEGVAVSLSGALHCRRDLVERRLRVQVRQWGQVTQVPVPDGHIDAVWLSASSSGFVAKGNPPSFCNSTFGVDSFNSLYLCTLCPEQKVPDPPAYTNCVCWSEWLLGLRIRAARRLTESLSVAARFLHRLAPRRPPDNSTCRSMSPFCIADLSESK